MSDLACIRLLSSYWGKADPDACIGISHHSVLKHCIDVAACAFTILELNAVLRERLYATLGLGGTSLKATFAALCALHDIGKFDTRFQRKAPEVADRLRPQSANIGRVPYDHGAEGFRQIEDDEEARAHLRSRLGPKALILLRTVCGHHGAFPSREEPDPSRSLLPRALRREDEEARRYFVDSVVDHFISLGAVLPWRLDVDGALAQRLGGLCAVSDWLGSNTDFFPYDDQPIDSLLAYWDRASGRAQTACRDAGLIRSSVSQISFGGLFPGYTPRGVQVLTEQLRLRGPALVVIEAEMGQGKTEAALSVAAQLLGRCEAEGLTFALPTMATSNAIFERVRDILPRLFVSNSVQFALAHGRARRQPGFQEVIARGLRPKDEDATEASIACARWFLTGKRVLLAQVGVGTIDQALQAGLNVRHQFVRMFGLSRNVVIIDEVHAYDAYMEVLLEHLLRWLGALEVPVLLLSATLPSHRRAALARAWSNQPAPSDDIEADGSMQLDNLATAISTPYPLVSVATRESVYTLSSNSSPVARTVAVECVASDTASVASRLVAAAKAGGRVLWVRNTVREAQDAFHAVAARCDHAIERTLFHSRFRNCDRAKIEASVLERYGKRAPAGGRILIATQVVEQSLDLDFDEMHSDLAPIDLLLQRMGRLHRHSRPRLPRFASARFIVHRPTEEDLGLLRFGSSAYVYDTVTLWIANRTLLTRKEIRLPEDIRPLIEETYHPESRAALLREGGPLLQDAEADREGVLEARRTRARRCCIPSTTTEPDGMESLSDDDDTVMAFTRDGMSVTLLPFTWDGAGGRDLGATSSDNWTINTDHHEAWKLASELSDQVLSIPARASAEGLVSSQEQAAWDVWRARFQRFAQNSGLGARVVPVPTKRHADGSHRGWLSMGGRKRRVLYSETHGMVLASEKDEAEAR